ncbi:N-6 DNA methylase [Streptomyces ardesiacus]|uniref:type I restriction-modification system subunit M n=1 Tax=Streptomyces ardesiacus TaxID=285564 RepID=UPI00364A7141
MADGELRDGVDRVWDAFWSAGISNPLEVIEQITYLMFIRRLDDLQTLKERKATRTGKPIESPIYTDETAPLRWSRFTNESPDNMLMRVRDGVFPWLRNLGGEDSTYSQHMKDARFTITTANLLAKVVDMLNEMPLGERDTKGDLYEYMLSKVARAGRNGQFQTPRHIVQLMVEMTAPGLKDEICDPACGTAGFLVASAEYVEDRHQEALLEPVQRKHFESMFHGFDFDSTMLRIGSMNMLLHHVDNPDIRHRDSLAEGAADDVERYSLILANPPFAGSLDYEATAKDLQQVIKTKKTELLFLALSLRLLKPGGRAAVIVPDGVLFGSTKAHKELRKILVEDQKLDAVVKLPSGVFKPYAGVSTAILFFTKTNSGGTDNVWFYEVMADGWSLDDKRQPLLDAGKLGPVSPEGGALSPSDHVKNNLPDVLARWQRRNGAELERNRTEQSFCIPKADIAAQGYDLSPNRYKQVDRQKTTVARRQPANGAAGREASRGNPQDRRIDDVALIFSGQADSVDAPKGQPSEDLQRVIPLSALESPLPELTSLPITISAASDENRILGGDVLGSLATGRWLVAPEHYDGVQAGMGITVVRLNHGVISPDYMAAFLTHCCVTNMLRESDDHDGEDRGIGDLRIPIPAGDFAVVAGHVVDLDLGLTRLERNLKELLDERASMFNAQSPKERSAILQNAARRSSILIRAIEKIEQPYQVIQDTYPYGIARAVRRFKNSATLVERHEAALQCSESLIVSLGIFSLALAKRKVWHDLRAIREWIDSVDRGGVAIGHWVGVTREVGEKAQQLGDPASGLANAVARKKRGEGLIADLDKIVEMRNSIRHGAGPRTRAEFERSLEVIEPIMRRSLEASEFLTGAQWVHTERLRWRARERLFDVSALSLMGDHPDFANVSFSSNQPMADGQLHARTDQSRMIELSPFCILQDCPSCLSPEIFYPDRLKNSTAVMKSLDRGHPLESDEIAEDMRAWISTVRNG